MLYKYRFPSLFVGGVIFSNRKYQNRFLMLKKTKKQQLPTECFIDWGKLNLIEISIPWSKSVKQTASAVFKSNTRNTQT